MTGVAAIVLAAGESRRMGSPKALLPFRGATFVDTVIATLRASGIDDIFVVLGPHPDTIRGGARLENVTVVVNPDYAHGQFSSLRCGVTALTAERGSRSQGGVVVALVDQPHVPADVPRALLREFETSRAPIIRPTWEGRGGHPILLSAETFPFLLSLPATRTLFDVVTRYQARRRDVSAPDASVTTDVDTPEDFSRLTERENHGDGPAEK